MTSASASLSKQPSDLNGRSNLIDVTFQTLQASLAGHLSILTTEQLDQSIRLRIEKLKNCHDPYTKPSKESRTKVESGNVTLADGVKLVIEEEDKQCIWAISKRFDLDEVEALILLRSFFFNDGLPPTATEMAGFIEELLDAIAPFYFEERLSILRMLIPMARIQENLDHPLHETVSEVMPKIISDPTSFASSLISHFTAKTNLDLPPDIASSPRYGSKWAKQLIREQLCLLEVLFWTMWGDVSCTAPLVLDIYRSIAQTDLGAKQNLSTLLLDSEGSQLLRDIEHLLIVIAIEVLNIEQVIDQGTVELTEAPSDPLLLTSSPQHLTELHNLVMAFGDTRYTPIMLAWACVLNRLTALALDPDHDLPARYRKFVEIIIPHSDPNSRSLKPPDPVFQTLAVSLLRPEVGLLTTMGAMMTTSPLFVTSAALSTSSAITEPNSIAFRSVIKGLLMGLTELIRVEYLPEFELFTELWCAVFVYGEPRSLAALCRQFWEIDWRIGSNRRSLLDVSRTRFPTHFRPLVRLLLAMTGSGTPSLDPSSSGTAGDSDSPIAPSDADRKAATVHVYEYFHRLRTFTQVIPPSGPLGYRALYEVSRGDGLTYTNTRAIRLPGGSILPVGSQGRLLSSPRGDGGPLVISWDHVHSGWRIVLEVMRDYVQRRRGSGTSLRRQDSMSVKRSADETQPVNLTLDQIGVEIGSSDEEDVIAEVLDLLWAMLQDNDELSERLVQGLDDDLGLKSGQSQETLASPPTANNATSAPDLVQVIIWILEDVLARSITSPGGGGLASINPTTSRLITSAIHILCSIVRVAPERVWPFLRSDTLLFGGGPQQQRGSTPILFKFERQSGNYGMTLALLDLVKSLLGECIESSLAITRQFMKVKEDVLVRALRFVHAEIWVEHMGWKYARLGDRFEIGWRVTELYGELLANWTATNEVRNENAMDQDQERPPVFPRLAAFVMDSFLHRATTATVAPIISSINSAKDILLTLYSGRRTSDARGLVRYLESQLRLCRTVLTLKRSSSSASVNSKLCLLEQVLCSGVAGGATSLAPRRTKVDPVDTITGFVRDRNMGPDVPLEAVRLLSALSLSLAMTQQQSAPSLASHISNAEAVAMDFIRIVRHPFDNLALRNAVWNFMTLAVDTQPAFATLFVSGSFRIPKDQAGPKTPPAKDPAVPEKKSSLGHSGVEAACETVMAWEELWATNPRLLASALGFLEVVWHHALEHAVALEPTRADQQFWTRIASIIKQKLGTLPGFEVSEVMEVDGQLHSNLNEQVTNHAYRCVAKAHALVILALDLNLNPRKKADAAGAASAPSFVPPATAQNAPSVKAFLDFINNSTSVEGHVLEAIQSSYDPHLQDSLLDEMRVSYPTFGLENLRRARDQPMEHEFGDDYLFPVRLVHDRLASLVSQEDPQAQELHLQVYSVNLNWSLSDAQISLTKAWRRLLQEAGELLKGNENARRPLFAIVVPMSKLIAAETRAGSVMTEVHAERLSVLLSLLELGLGTTTASAPTTAASPETKQLVQLMKNLHDIVTSPVLRPIESIHTRSTSRFHRPLLHIAFSCARRARVLGRQPKTFTAEQRVIVSSSVFALLCFVIDALRDSFDVTQLKTLDAEVDKDLELLVAVFDQCIRPELHSSSSTWLAKCQEADLIRASLDVFTKIDIAGFNTDRRQSLYARHILNLHLAFASLPSSAERLANEGLVAAYSNNSLTSDISSGSVDVVHPDLPAEHSPAHQAWCLMLSVIEGLVLSIGSSHFVEGEMVGFVQLYGAQLSRTLGWTVGEPLTLPFVHELERTVGIFYMMSMRSEATLSDRDVGTTNIMRAFTERALVLLQHLNYALSHPNHLASLFEVSDSQERRYLEQETRKLSVESSHELLDPSKRPLLASLVQRLCVITRDLTSTLAIASSSDMILVSDPSEWPLDSNQVLPHAKVALSEPASLGTLVELGNSAADVLRHLLSQPSLAKPNLPFTISSIPAFTPTDCVSALRQTLEAVLTYSTTQLVVWLHQSGTPDQPLGGVDANLDGDDGTSMDVDMTIGSRDQHKARRRSSMSADRLRRGLTGELAGDLHQLLVKAKVIIDKCPGQDLAEKNLTAILINFLESRIQ